MTTYMGPGLGSLVPVRCLSGLQVQASTNTAISDGLSGRRIYVDPPSKPSLRTWQASINVSDPNEVGTLVELESLRVPLRMVTDDAAVGNILPPTPGDAFSGGPVQLVDGVAAASGGAWPPFPVIPGLPVTVGAYVRAAPGGTATVRLDWLNLDGSLKEIAASATSTVSVAPLPRLTVSVASVPPNVHVAKLTVLNAQAARASATWTPAAVPWRPGMGAEAVYLSPLSYDVILAWSDGRALSSYSYTVTEVSA